MKGGGSPDVSGNELDTAGRNRRDAYRVTDRIGLTVRALEPAEFGCLARALWRRHEIGDAPPGTASPDAPERPSAARLEMLGRVQPEVRAWIAHLEARLAGLDAADAAPGGAPDPGVPVATGEGAMVAGDEVDLSEGGLGCRLAEALEPGTLVALTLVLPGRAAPLELAGEVVRCAPAPDGDGSTVSVRFRELHPADRGTLVAHVFAVQRERLRRRRAG